MAWSSERSYPKPPGWAAATVRIRQRDPFCRIQGPRCTRISTEVDHIVAVHLGGGHEDSNLQGACHACHADKTAQEAAARRPRARRAPEPHPGLRAPHAPAVGPPGGHPLPRP